MFILNGSPKVTDDMSAVSLQVASAAGGADTVVISLGYHTY